VREQKRFRHALRKDDRIAGRAALNHQFIDKMFKIIYALPFISHAGGFARGKLP